METGKFNRQSCFLIQEFSFKYLTMFQITGIKGRVTVFKK